MVNFILSPSIRIYINENATLKIEDFNFSSTNNFDINNFETFAEIFITVNGKLDINHCYFGNIFNYQFLIRYSNTSAFYGILDTKFFNVKTLFGILIFEEEILNETFPQFYFKNIFVDYVTTHLSESTSILSCLSCDIKIENSYFRYL